MRERIRERVDTFMRARRRIHMHMIRHKERLQHLSRCRQAVTVTALAFEFERGGGNPIVFDVGEDDDFEITFDTLDECDEVG